MVLMAATLTDGESGTAAEELEGSKKRLLAATAGLTPEQWTYRSGEGRWTIAEVVEHLSVTEGAIPMLLEKQLMATAVSEKDLSGKDKSIRPLLVNRTNKVQTMEMLKPTGRFADGAAALRAFSGMRDKMIAYAKTTPDALRQHAMPHPALGELDGYQWILFVAGHTDRHTEQILEVKAAAGWPK